MALNLHHLDEMTRQHMIAEIERDVQEGCLYISPRLTEECAKEYAQLLKNAAVDGHDGTLAAELVKTGRLKSHEPRKTKNGTSMVKVPITTPETLSEGEFNRFYMRGLCARAKAEGTNRLVVYRAKHVSNPRPESEVMIGTDIEVEQLLTDLRAHIGTDTALGLPPGPNSGLSIRLP
ncbi:hypothetical protein [Granulicella mallensis]|jgi:hypothetical protein|uniref:Uncharacterized protein n=1 Tax=Granulicella mallensis TaxID=940614 RepID=A0A7W7ZSM8_9BACT|nr:hypothetical protein [Granulicella mallensis]MBB5065068.1 hypothetical protein [Granulicella mallensis]